MANETFFETQTPESAAKTDIVTNFFIAWLNIIGNAPRFASKPLAYMELFAGPGAFNDGIKSTPLLVLEHILASQFAGRFNVILNEMFSEYADRLEAKVAALPGLNKLREPPIFLRKEITPHNVTDFLKYLRDFPTVLFVDPWGYKGITLDLFRQFINVGGRDAIFFFNYRRVNAALSNVQFEEHIQAMLGSVRAARLQVSLSGMDPESREQKVHAAVEEALHGVGVKFVHRFEFEQRGDSLFYICQSDKGYRVMKDIMNKRSTTHNDGVPSNSFSRYGNQPQQQGLFDESPLKEIVASLLSKFAGRTMSFDRIVREHHPGTNFVEQNYRDVLNEMETRAEISVHSTITRRAGTFGPSVQITFQSRHI